MLIEWNILCFHLLLSLPDRFCYICTVISPAPLTDEKERPSLLLIQNISLSSIMCIPWDQWNYEIVSLSLPAALLNHQAGPDRVCMHVCARTFLSHGLPFHFFTSCILSQPQSIPGWCPEPEVPSPFKTRIFSGI